MTAVLRAQLGIIEANLAGALADTDTEFLHDFRVAVRRPGPCNARPSTSSRPRG